MFFLLFPFSHHGPAACSFLMWPLTPLPLGSYAYQHSRSFFSTRLSCDVAVFIFRVCKVVLTLCVFPSPPLPDSPICALCPQDNVLHLCGNSHGNDVGVSGVKCQSKSDCPEAAKAPRSVGHRHTPNPGVPPDVSLSPPLRTEPSQVYSWLIRIPRPSMQTLLPCLIGKFGALCYLFIFSWKGLIRGMLWPFGSTGATRPQQQPL